MKTAIGAQRRLALGLTILMLAAGAGRAATTGFNQTGAGPWDYNTAANWAGSTINGVWDTSLTLTAAQTVTFAAPTSLSTGLTFKYGGNYALSLLASAAGTQTLTLGGDLALSTGGGTTANVTIGDANNHVNVDLGGTTRTATVAASRMLTLRDVVSNGALVKAGVGTMTLNSGTVNTFTGGLTVNYGTLALNLGNLGTPTDLVNSANTLTLASGTLAALGKNSSASAQTLGDLTLNSGAAVISSTGGSSSTLNLTIGSTWTRNAGGSVNVQLGTGGTVTSSPGLSNSIIGPWASFGTGASTKYATVSVGVLAGLTGTAAAAPANLTDTTGAANYELAAAAGTAGAGLSANTIRFAGSAAGTTAPSGTFTVNGLMNAGTAVWTIGTGALTIGSTKELVVNAANNSISFSGALQDNGGGASSLTKTGAQALTLTAASTYSGGTTLNAGSLYLNVGTAVGTGSITINPGTSFGGVYGGSAKTLSNNNPIVLNGDWNHPDEINSFNMGTGAVTINRPLVITTTHRVDFSGTVFSGPGGLNALDVTAGNTGNDSGVTISAGVSLRAGQTVTAGNGGSSYLVLSGIIQDGGSGYGLTVANSAGGWLYLTGANTFTGALTINSGGQVNLGNNTPAGSLSASAPIVNNGTLRFYRSNTITQGTDFNSVISGAGGITQQGGTTILNGANSYAGVTSVTGGTLSFNSIANAGVNSAIGAYPSAGAAGITLSSGTLRYVGGSASSDRGLTMSGNTTVDVNPASTALTLGACSLGYNTLTVSGGAGSSLSLGAVTLTGNATLSPNSGIGLTVASVGGTSQSLTKAGAGTLYLSGANTYAGGTTISAGTLNISADGNLGTGALTFSGNSTLQFATGSSVTLGAGRSVVINSGITGTFDTSLAAATIAGLISGPGNLTKIGNNNLTIGGASTFTGNLTVSGGRVVMGNASALLFSPYVTTGSTGPIGLDVTGYASLTLGGLSGAVNLATAITGYGSVTNLTLNLYSSQAYSGIIADGMTGMTLTKTGAGTQTLTGVNTYTGATTVNAGLLLINTPGSLHASSAVGVTGGGIGGTGTINGSITLSGTGAVDLRSGATGTLTVNGGLSAIGASGANSLYFDLGTAAAVDKITVAGAVAISNPVVVRLNQLSAPTSRLTAGTYDLLTTATGTLPAIGNFTLATTSAFGQTFSLALDGATSTKLQLTSTQAAAGPAAAWWGGATDGNWSAAGNWYTGIATGTGAGAAPSYQSNVRFYTTTPAAGNPSTLDVDFDINSLTITNVASAVTINGTKTLTIEASNFNGNPSGNGINVYNPASGTLTHTINANVALAANQTWSVSNNATLTVGGNVTDLGGGSYTLTKAGLGTLNLNGTTSLGSLSIGYNTANAAGTVAVGSGAALSVGAGIGNNLYVGWGSGSSANGSGSLNAAAASIVTVNVGNLMVGGTCGGTGVMNLGASNTITAATQFGISKGSWGGPNGYGTVTTASGSSTTINTPTMYVGYNTPNGTTGGSGYFTLGSSATLTVSGISGGRTMLYVGVANSANGGSDPGSYMNLSGGAASLTLSGLVISQTIGSSGAGNSAFGALTFSSDAANRLDVSGTGNAVLIGDSGTSAAFGGSLTLGGGLAAVTSTDNSTAILMGNKRSSGTPTGTLNLNGGTMTITTTGSAIAGGGGTSLLKLNGGTLKAGASSSTFLNALTGAYIYSGGVTFDTAGNSITIPQALTAAPNAGFGLAVSTVAPTAGGSGYTSAPNVTFGAPASGTAATGIVTINAAGQVTGIYITNPGSGYTSGQTVTISLSGGGGAGATFTNPTATASQSTGGLTKAGAGTVSLTVTNNYTGNTSINAGVLNAGVAENAGSYGPFGKQLANAAGTILFGGGTLQYSAANSSDYSGRFSTGGNEPISVDVNGQTVTFATAIQGTGTSLSLTNSTGSGKLFLTGNNSFTGPINVYGGTLGGIRGSTGGALTNWATLSPGTNSFGSFTNIGNVVLQPDSTLAVDLGGSSNDLLVVGGDLSVGGTLTLVPNGVPLASTEYLIATNTGAQTGIFAETNGVPDGYSVIYESNRIILSQTSATPIIDVRGTNGVPIGDGNVTPSLSLGTDFGYGAPGVSVTNTFVITNSGLGTLTLTNLPAVVIAGDASFQVSAQPTPTVVPAGDSVTFSVAFTTPADGNWRTGLVSIASDDPDAQRSQYTFALRGGPLTGTWTNDASGNWSQAFNWHSGSVPQAAGYSANFLSDITASRTATNDLASLSIGNLLFGDTAPDSDWTVTGNLLRLDNLGGGSTITVSNRNATISCVVTGAETVTKAGAGTLTLAAGNTYTGVTTVSAGSIAVGHNMALSTNGVTLAGGGLSAASGAWTITNKINLAFAGLFDTAGNALTLSGSVTNTGALFKLGAGTLTLNVANTYSGGTTVSNGTLRVGVSGAIPSGASLTIDGGVFDMNSLALTVNPLSGLGGSLTNAGSGATLTLSQGSSTSYAGNIGTVGNVTKSGSGTLTLSGSTMIGGDLKVGDGTASGSLTVGGGGSISVGSGSGNVLSVGINSGGSGTLDASSSQGVTANVGSFKVGGTTGGTGYAYLGAVNTVTAATEFGVGHGAWGFPSGYGTVTTPVGGTTTIHSPAMFVGHTVPNGTTGGWGRFVQGTGGAFSLDGLSGGRAALWVAVHGGWNGGNPDAASYLDLGGGGSTVANLKLKSLLIGQLRGGSNTETGWLTLSSSSANHLDISGSSIVCVEDNAVTIPVVVAIGHSVSSGGTASGMLTLGNLDATSAIVAESNGTAILLAHKGSTGTSIGTLNLLGGTLTITTTGTAITGGGGTSALNLNGGATLKAGASSSTWIQNVTTATITNSAAFDTGGYDITVPQVFTGPGSLTKVGAGTLTLSGMNTFTGPMIVAGGTLAGVQIGSGGMAVTNQATLSPGGSSFATFVHTGNVAQVTSGTLAIDLGGSSNDLLRVAGNLTLSGTLSIVTNDMPLSESSYVIITNTGARTGVFSATNGLPADCTVVYEANRVVISYNPTSPPQTPAGLVATPANQRVLLSWPPTSGATGYNVFSSTADGGPYAMIGANVQSTTFTNGGLVNGTTWYYVVTGTNDYGESGYSSQASATPSLQIPPVPSNVVALAGYKAVGLTWAASLDAAEYRVKRSLSVGGPYSLVSTPVTMRTVDVGLTNGTTYYYVVSATNSAGESANSTEVSGTPAVPSSTNGSWITDGNGLWSGSNNWAGGVVAAGIAGTASFTNAISATRVVTVDYTPWLINSLVFSNTGAYGFAITNGTLELAGTSPTLTIHPGSTATVWSAISTTTTVTKAGTGPLYLNGATTTRGLNIAYNTGSSVGSVVVGNGASLVAGSGSSDNVYIGWGSGTSANGSGTLDASATSNVAINVGNLMVGGTCGGTGVMNLGASNTITAATQFGISKGSWGGPNGYGTVTTASGSTTTINTPTLYVGYNTPNGTTGGSGTLTLGSGATLSLSGTSGGAMLYIGVVGSANGGSDPGSTMDLSGGAASLTLSGLVISQTIGTGGSGNSAIGSLIFSSNAANQLAVSAAGNAVLIADSGVSANIGGTLTFGGGTAAITSTDNSTAILLANKRASSGIPTGTLNLLGGTVTITTTGSAIAGGGGTSRLNLNGGVTLQAGSSSTAWIQNLTSATITNSAGFDTAGYNVTIPQSFSGPGGLTKAGNGALYLTGTNTFAGPLTVTGGTLGGYCGSTGGGALTNQATLSPGTSVGVFTHSGNVTLDSSGTLVIEVDGATNDLLAVGGSATLGGTLQIVTNATPIGATEFTILTAAGGCTGVFASSNGLPAGASLRYEANSVVLVIPITEPPTVSNTTATVTGVGTATLAGQFAGPARGTVTFCWGTTDGGTGSVSSWQYSTNLGSTMSASFSANVDGLLYPLTYVYRVYATNGYGEDWSDSVTAFTSSNRPGQVALRVTNGLALWLDAGEASTMTLSGSTVNEWRDKMGGSTKETKQAGSPTWQESGIGGLPTVHFDTSSWMSDGANHPAPVTILYVSRSTIAGTCGRILGGRSNNFLLGYHGNLYNRFYFEGWVYPSGGSGGVSVDTNAHLFAATIPGAGQNSTVYEAGASLASNTSGTTGPNGLELNGYNGGAELSTADISEVLLYNRVLNSAELDLAGGYLETKYGLSTAYTNQTVGGTAPALVNLAATNVAGTTGWLNSQLSCTGAVYDVWVYWGPTDQATNAGLWASNALVGRYTNGTFTATYQATGLGAGTTNWYAFKASNALDQFWATPATNFVTLTLPDTPASLSAWRGDSNIRLAWTAAARADYYNVKRSLASGGPYSLIATTADLTYTDTGLTNGTPYYYVVSATNIVGESGDSGEAGATPAVLAADVTWINGSGGVWSDSANWTPNEPAPDPATIVNYNVAGTYLSTQNMDEAFLVNRFNFAAPQLTLVGNGIQLGGTTPQLNQNSASAVVISNALTLAADTTVSGSGAGTVQLGGAIGGAGGLTKSCSGLLTLSGTNTFSGTTLVSAGTLAVRNNAALQGSPVDTSGAGVIDVAGYTTPIFGGLVGSKNITSLITTGYGSVSGVTLNPGVGGSYSYSGLIANGSGSTTLTKSGAGTQTLSANNTYSGATIVSAGSLRMSGNNTTLGGGASGAGTLRIGTGALIYFSGSTITVSNLVLESSSQLQFATDIGTSGAVGTMTMLGSSLSVARMASRSIYHNVYLQGDVQFGAAGNGNQTTLQGGQGQVLDLGGATRTITVPTGSGMLHVYSTVQNGGLIKAGAATMRLYSANTFTGGVTLSEGILYASHAAALGTGTVTINAGTGINTYGVTMTSPAGYVFNGSFAAYNTAANTYLGNAPITLNTPITITVANTFTAGGTITGPGGLNAFDITLAHQGGTTYNVTIGAPIALRAGQSATMAGSTTIYSGVISDGGSGYGFAKAGTGTMEITAANTYSGDTAVTAGTLTASGVGTFGTGNVRVNAGTLRLNTSTGNAISNSRELTVGTSATVQLDSNETVDLLFLNGSYQPSGTWGGNSSAAVHKDSHFSGTGVLTVLSGRPTTTVLKFK